MHGFPSAPSRPTHREISEVLRTVGGIVTPRVVLLPPPVEKEQVEALELVVALRNATIDEQRTEIATLREQLEEARTNCNLYARDLQAFDERNTNMARTCSVARTTLRVIYHTTTEDDTRALADMCLEFLVAPQSNPSGCGVV